MNPYSVKYWNLARTLQMWYPCRWWTTRRRPLRDSTTRHEPTLTGDVAGGVESTGEAMTDKYVIEPPEERRRDLGLNRKLDRIIDILTSDPEPEETGDGDVTFEPDVDQLPTTAEVEQPEDEAGQGEGTANVAEGNRRPRFSFPSRRARQAVNP